jgi:hypothetical protein
MYTLSLHDALPISKSTQRPKPEKTVPLFSVHPLGEAKTTGTPTTKRNERPINANKASWKIRVINSIRKKNKKYKTFHS